MLWERLFDLEGYVADLIPLLLLAIDTGDGAGVLNEKTGTSRIA